MSDVSNIKDFQHSILNQINLAGYDTSNNVLDFKGNPVQLNPFASMTFQWQMQKLKKQYITWITLPFVLSENYWTVWLSVMNPKGKE